MICICKLIHACQGLIDPPRACISLTRSRVKSRARLVNSSQEVYRISRPEMQIKGTMSIIRGLIWDSAYSEFRLAGKFWPLGHMHESRITNHHACMVDRSAKSSRKSKVRVWENWKCEGFLSWSLIIRTYDNISDPNYAFFMGRGFWT